MTPEQEATVTAKLQHTLDAAHARQTARTAVMEALAAGVDPRELLLAALADVERYMRGEA